MLPLASTCPQIQSLRCQLVESPIGYLRIGASDHGLHFIEFPLQIHSNWPDAIEGTHPVLEQTKQQLREYFAAQRVAFDLPLAPAGSAFQLSVWGALTTVPYGHTISYGQLAQRIGNTAASRAVGAANGRNPIPIVIPCHRVIGADGSLTGFSGGLERKTFLLNLESQQTSFPAMPSIAPSAY